MLRVLKVVLPVCGLWFAGGCAQLPDTAFLGRRYATQAAKFKTALGPLSERRSAAIVADLKRQAGDIDILDKQLSLEQQIVGHPLVVGNKVTLLQDGPATYRAMFAAIRAAQDHVNVESYIIEDGTMGQQFAELLIERQKQGVQVNMIYDSVGAFGTKREFFDRLREAGVHVLEFNPVNPLATKKPWKLLHRDHRKLLVVDGRTAFLGGINIANVYSSGSSFGHGSSQTDSPQGWRDTDVQIDGPAVADFQRLFFETWNKQRGAPLGSRNYFPTLPAQGSDIVRAIGSGPDDPFSPSYLTFIAAITNAERQVCITNAYFVPDPQMIKALVGAAQRGVDVRIILPSHSDARMVYYAGRFSYTELLKGGVKIYERRGPPLHAKTAIVDGVWSSVGSSNLDWISALDNDELNAVILGRAFANQMLAAFRSDLLTSDEITLEAWKHRSPLERLKEGGSRLFGRFL